jgi:hypothetical protein
MFPLLLLLFWWDSLPKLVLGVTRTEKLQQLCEGAIHHFDKRVLVVFQMVVDFLHPVSLKEYFEKVVTEEEDPCGAVLATWLQCDA